MPSTCRKLAQVDPTQLRSSALPSLPSAPSVAPELKMKRSTFPRKCLEDRGSSRWIMNRTANVQDAEENHLSRADDDIVVDSGAAVSSASRTCAAHCPLKHGRQLALRSATGHIPAHHGHSAVPLQLRGREDCSFISLPSPT